MSGDGFEEQKAERSAPQHQAPKHTEGNGQAAPSAAPDAKPSMQRHGHSSSSDSNDSADMGSSRQPRRQTLDDGAHRRAWNHRWQSMEMEDFRQICQRSSSDIQKHFSYKRPYAHQAGGHDELIQIGKNIVAKPCSAREAWFYHNCAEIIGPYAPQCHGFWMGEDGKPTVLLQDLTSGFQKPCVLDIKMGSSTAAPDRPPSKQASCSAKDRITTTGSIGARICGLRVFKPQNEEYRSYDKHWGKNLKFDEFSSAVERFFDNGVRVRRDLAIRFLEKLQEILELFQADSMKFRFYASSILFIYEGAEELGNSCEQTEQLPEQKVPSDQTANLDVRMIDFAHVIPLDGQKELRDEAYICGLRNLIEIFEGIGLGLDPSAIQVRDLRAEGLETLQVSATVTD